MKEIVTICALIYNQHNSVFLMKSSKWKGYGLPGGKPVLGETEEETLRREILEELGIGIGDLVKAEEIVLLPTEDIDGKNKFIVKPYFARALTTEIQPNEEVGECGWFEVGEALGLQLLGPIRKTVEAYRVFLQGLGFSKTSAESCRQ